MIYLRPKLEDCVDRANCGKFDQILQSDRPFLDVVARKPKLPKTNELVPTDISGVCASAEVVFV